MRVCGPLLFIPHPQIHIQDRWMDGQLELGRVGHHRRRTHAAPRVGVANEPSPTNQPTLCSVSVSVSHDEDEIDRKEAEERGTGTSPSS